MRKLSLMILMMLLTATTINAQGYRNLKHNGAQKAKVIYRNTIRCLGIERDGSQTLRVVGEGRNKSDAREQAMKNAVWAVIFDGIKDGANAGCSTKPLITEERAQEKYEDYFNIFFLDNGAYKEYVNMSDTKYRSKDKSKTKLNYSIEITVQVRRAELQRRLQDDNVIK